MSEALEWLRETYDALLTVDLNSVWALLGQVVSDPGSDPRAAMLALLILLIVTGIAVSAAVLVFLSGSEQERPAPAAADRVSVSPQPAQKSARPPALSREEGAWRVARTVLAGLIVLSGAWIAVGASTSTELTCLSCHESGLPHTERLIDESSVDPHRETPCIRCHEPGGTVARVTHNVPGRLAHFLLAVLQPESSWQYGRPIHSSACESCHNAVAAAVLTSEARGIRVSHREPMEAGAMCVDCHEIQQVSGAVGAWTAGMSACLTCHDDDTASAECESCHVKDFSYAIHVNREPQPRRLVQDIDCGSCHDQTSCDDCHGIRMPHTAAFVAIEHPRAATLDTWNNGGRTCRKCHTDTNNPCTKCHRNPFPGHSVSVWPKIHGLRPEAGFDSCDGCHGGMARLEGRNFCGVCHEEYVGFKR